MLEDYSPPPRRDAPPAMKNRIRGELLASRGTSPLRVILPVAAAVALVAGVVGGVAAQQLPLHHDIIVVPAGSPTARPSEHPQPSPAKATAKVPRPMTDTEIKLDEAHCLTASVLTAPVTRKGKLRVASAMVERPVGNGTKLPAARYLVLTDNAGTFICVDGVFQTWSDHGESDNVVINKQAAAWQDPVTSGSTRECRAGGDARVETDVLIRVTPNRVKSAKVTVKAAGKRLIPPVTVAAHGQWIYVPIAIVGKAAWQPLNVSIAAVDSHGETLQIQPYAPGRSITVTSLKLPVEPCR